MRISRSRKSKPTLAITLGDPGGIGPEVTLKALASRKIGRLANFLLIGPEWIIKQESKKLRLRVNARIIDTGDINKSDFKKGKISKASGRAALESIDKAIKLAKSKKIQGIITAPVNKESINRAGFVFPGHTEYLAKAFGVKKFVMLLVGGGLKVAVVTRHIALKDVTKKLKSSEILDTIIIVNRYLEKYFKIKNPKIGVCGLNPHAGEGGIFGKEEIKIIGPAIRSAEKRRISVYGPVPADSAYFEALSGRFDAVISMYHDQGLIPVKTLSRNEGVNVTLGLPIPRTSPDHGTAFDIADKRIADPGSMMEAISLCAKMAC